MEDEDSWLAARFAAREKILVSKQAEAAIALKAKQDETSIRLTGHQAEAERELTLARYQRELAQLELEKIEHNLQSKRKLLSEEKEEEEVLHKSKRPRPDTDLHDSVPSRQQEDQQQTASAVERGQQHHVAIVAAQLSPHHHRIPTSAAGTLPGASDQDPVRAGKDEQNSAGRKKSTLHGEDVLPKWTVPTLAFQAQKNTQPDPPLLTAVQQHKSNRETLDPRLRRQSILRPDGPDISRRPSTDGVQDGEEVNDGPAAPATGQARNAGCRRQSRIPEQALYRPPPLSFSFTDSARRSSQSNAAMDEKRRSPASKQEPLASATTAISDPTGTTLSTPPAKVESEETKPPIPRWDGPGPQTPQAAEDNLPQVRRVIPKWGGPPKPALPPSPSPPRQPRSRVNNGNNNNNNNNINNPPPSADLNNNVTHTKFTTPHRQETFQRFAHVLLSKLQLALNSDFGLRSQHFFQQIEDRVDRRTFDHFGALTAETWDRVYTFKRGERRVDGMVDDAVRKVQELLDECIRECEEYEEREIDERRREAIVGRWVKRASELRV